MQIDNLGIRTPRYARIALPRVLIAMVPMIKIVLNVNMLLLIYNLIHRSANFAYPTNSEMDLIRSVQPAILHVKLALTVRTPVALLVI